MESNTAQWWQEKFGKRNGLGAKRSTSEIYAVKEMNSGGKKASSLAYDIYILGGFGLIERFVDLGVRRSLYVTLKSCHADYGRVPSLLSEE